MRPTATDGMICLASMNETTRVRHREYQIVSRDEVSAGHGRQYQKPPLSQGDTELSVVHCRLRVACHYTPCLKKTSHL